MKEIRTTIGNTSLELRNVIKVFGHDDSIPFNADLYIKGTRIGRAWNDGWGGESVIDYDTQEKKKVAEDLDNYIKEHYTMHLGGYSWQMSLIEVIDYLVCYALDGYSDLSIEDLHGVEKIA